MHPNSLAYLTEIYNQDVLGNDASFEYKLNSEKSDHAPLINSSRLKWSFIHITVLPYGMVRLSDDYVYNMAIYLLAILI